MSQPSRPWPPLRTHRLVLRDFRGPDMAGVHAYAADPEVARFMRWGPNTPKDTAVFLEGALAAQADWPRLSINLAIEHAGVASGAIGLRLRDAENRTAEIGWCLRRDLWRQGLMREAAGAMLDFAFGPLGLHRVVATCDPLNTASFRLMERLGLRREGHFRHDALVKGEWRDTLAYAVLADEWRGGG